MTAARIGYRWHLRRLMAEKDMYATTQLGPLRRAKSGADSHPRAKSLHPGLLWKLLGNGHYISGLLVDVGALLLAGSRYDDPTSYRMTHGGEAVGQMCGTSTFAEYTTVDVRSIVVIPQDIPLDSACLVVSIVAVEIIVQFNDWGAIRRLVEVAG